MLWHALGSSDVGFWPILIYEISLRVVAFGWQSRPEVAILINCISILCQLFKAFLPCQLNFVSEYILPNISSYNLGLLFPRSDFLPL